MADHDLRTEPIVPSGSRPVLHLDPPYVEAAWAKGGRLRFHAAQVPEWRNDTVVAVASTLLRQLGVRSQRILLCLGPSVFEHRQVLLEDLSDDQLTRVLARRAANGLGVQLEGSLFWAYRCAQPDASAARAQATWLVHSQRRGDHRDLLLRLRAAGYPVRRAVATADVLTRMVDDSTGTEGHVLASSTGRVVHAQLFRGNELVQESRLPLEVYEERADTYASLVQDVRQLAAFWSKGSRGAPLANVGLVGFSPSEVERLSGPLGIATQGAQVLSLATVEEGSYEAIRKNLLALCLRSSDRAHDLRTPLPWRRSRVAATALAATALAAVLGLRVGERWDARVAERGDRVDVERLASFGADDYRATRDAYERAHTTLVSSYTSLDGLRSRGFDLGAAVADVASLETDVHVRHVSIDDSEGEARVVLEGEVGRGAAAARELELLRRRLLRDERFSRIVVEPSSRVPLEDAGEPLRFTLTCFVGGTDA